MRRITAMRSCLDTPMAHSLPARARAFGARAASMVLSGKERTTYSSPVSRYATIPTRTTPPPARSVAISCATLAFTSLITPPMLPVVSMASTRSRSGRPFRGDAAKQVDQVAWSVGYEDATAFRRVFGRLVGLSPGDYRRRFGAEHEVAAAA